MASLPECVLGYTLLLLGYQISLAVRSVGRPPPATDKAELGAVAAGAKCSPLSLGEAGERDGVLRKTSWRRQSWRWRGRETLSRGGHFSLPSPQPQQPGRCPLSSRARGERWDASPARRADFHPGAGWTSERRPPGPGGVGGVKGKGQGVFPKGGTCVSKT